MVRARLVPRRIHQPRHHRHPRHKWAASRVLRSGPDRPSRREVPQHPATAAFTKGAVLTGLYEGRLAATDQPAPRLVVVEGPLDAIAVTLAGGGHTIGVAPGGTALTNAQIDLVAQHCPDRQVWMATDTDAAGKKALRADTERFLAQGLNPRLVPLPPATDPAELYRTDPALLGDVLDVGKDAPPAMRAVVDDIADTAGLDPEHDLDATARFDVVRRMGHYVALLPDDQWEQEIASAAAHFPAADVSFQVEQLYYVVIKNAINYEPIAPVPTGIQARADKPRTALERIAQRLERNGGATPRERSRALRRLSEDLSDESASTPVVPPAWRPPLPLPPEPTRGPTHKGPGLH